MSNIVKYGSYTIDDAELDEQESKKVGGGGQFLKMQPGRNIVRFLPPKPGQKLFLAYFQHFVKLAGMQNAASFACPAKLASKPCPVCQEAHRLESTGNAADAAVARTLFPRRRVLANVIDRKNPDAGPQILAFGKVVHDALIAIRKNEDAGGDFTHPEEGFDISIEKSGAGLKTEYAVQASRKTTPLGDLAWIDQQPDLAKYATVKSPEEIMQICSLQPTALSAPAGGGRSHRSLSAHDASVVNDDDVNF
jgi:hypothetical protein